MLSNERQGTSSILEIMVNNVVKIQITIVMYFKEMEFKQYSTKLQVKHEHIYGRSSNKKVWMALNIKLVHHSRSTIPKLERRIFT